ncbi:MAG: tetratricopeptide repeat protein, partial [Gammaproteobacteria bacterium]|nr:tetratricopeptide repeat protein [Gammaproteobacteria bacterium]
MFRFLLSTLSAWLRNGRRAPDAPGKSSENSAHTQDNAERELSALLRGLEESPESLDLLLKTGVAFARRGDMPRSIEYFRRGVQIAPESPALHNNLGLSLQKTGQLSDAVRYFQNALRLNVDFPAAWHNLANALNEIGQVEEGREAYRRCLALAPDHVAARSDYLLSLNYRQDVSRQEIFEEHREWARRHALPSDTSRPMSRAR